jgi:PAS domain S-box-containing protein
VTEPDIRGRGGGHNNGAPPDRTEGRYRALFDAIDEGFCIIEVIFDEARRPVDYRFLETNAAFARQTGLRAAQGQLMRALAPAHEQYWFDTYGDVALKGESIRFERQASSLEARWFDVFAFRVDAPEERHVAVLFSDVTERRRAVAEREAALTREREANALLDAISASAPVGLAFFDRELRFRRINARLAQMNGLSVEEHLGHRPDELLPDVEGLETALSRLQELIATGRSSLDIEVHGYTPAHPGVERAWLESFFPVRVGGEVVGLGSVVEEITERKAAERAMRESAAQLQDADRRKDEFLATLAHELRNPLAPIRNGVQILRLMSAGNQTLQRTTEMMERQMHHLVRLVDDLLDVSRITRGKIQLRRERVILNDVISSALESCETLFEPHGHELRVRIPPEPLAVVGDRDRLTQVFSNLLSNAAKFTPRDGTVWIELERDNDDAVASVRDTGVGIPADRLQSVFEMFSQVHAPHGNDGLGIGLALVRQLVILHGGAVTAHSDGPGQGSCFAVRLPLSKQSATSVRFGSDASLPGLAPVKRKILVVDDNLDAAQSLRELLALQGHDVALCTSGAEAVALAARDPPDIIFMDIGMPGMDGIAAARLIRAQAAATPIRIIALTGWGLESDRERTRAAGIYEHLVKPVSPEELLDLI